ncbi:MAG: ABC transporter substrate-binding protein [Deltaproteobacteria bacterium CG23_combo_of_CG06-09_8_20_14_all_51_20]|nr:MAG: ABC transporter substrate-binding protein [Deltaproteobacteria bacterium CG23_combo_of_CG06-09_8_20_14_all_51_20]PIY22009.1 MAG: ABC transporter substrate-binding protein [Deltaproteobacteria bacterium CG_4_10_14_3_um_filter_51_14]
MEYLMEINYKLKFYITILIFFIMFFCSSMAFSARPQYLIKFATVAPDGSAWMKRMRTLDDKLRKDSGNRLGFAFYPGGVAGDEIDVLKKMRISQIHCAAFSGVGFGQILPMLRVLDLPFLFRNYKEIDATQRQLKDFFSDQFKQKGFHLLAWAEVGNAHVFSRKPITSIKDFEGLKAWAWSGDPVARETFVHLGVSPIQLPITDVTTALSTGMIDTVYAPPIGALALQWHSSMSYMTEWPLAHATGAILISSSSMEKLPTDLSQMLTRETGLAMEELTSTLRNQSRDAIDVIRKGGISLTPPPPDNETKTFSDVHRKVAASLRDKLFPGELLDRVYGILEGLR